MNASAKSTIFRLVELITIIVCLVLHFKTPKETDPLTIVMASGTFFGYTIILAGWFAMKNSGNPINKAMDVCITFLGSVLFIATGALIFIEWSRNDVERIKKCLPITDNHSTNDNIVRKIVNFVSHIAADSVASKLDKMGYKNFLYSSDTYVMAVVKASLSIISGVLFIIDIILNHKFQDIFDAPKAPTILRY